MSKFFAAVRSRKAIRPLIGGIAALLVTGVLGESPSPAASQDMHRRTLELRREYRARRAVVGRKNRAAARRKLELLAALARERALIQEQLFLEQAEAQRQQRLVTSYPQGSTSYSQGSTRPQATSSSQPAESYQTIYSYRSAPSSQPASASQSSNTAAETPERKARIANEDLHRAREVFIKEHST